MSKPDPVEQALEALAVLRRSGEVSPDKLATSLGPYLANRSNLVVARAAIIAREAGARQMAPQLVAAFVRLMANPQKLDKRCAATIEIVSALYQFDYLEPEVYLRGLQHVQFEASFGPPVDSAARLRGVSAQGLLRTRLPRATQQVTAMLVDPEPAARLGAARALATNGGEAGALLLRLKVLTGDSDADVLAECFLGILKQEGAAGLEFVGAYVHGEDEALREAALQAIAASRLAAAFPLLQEKYSRSLNRDLRGALLAAIAALRTEEALAFLVSVLQDAPLPAAKQAATALAAFRASDSLGRKIDEAIASRTVEERRQLAALLRAE